VTGGRLEQTKREKIAGEPQLSKANAGNFLSGEKLAKVSLPRPVRGSLVNDISLHLSEAPEECDSSHYTTYTGGCQRRLNELCCMSLAR
jgi:hypothetical protein